MVEFGLKLQDNKVEEWADKYIDYEKLKRLIQNAKKAHKQSKDMERRNEFIVSEVRLEYVNGEPMKKVNSLGNAEEVSLDSGGGGLDEFLMSSRHSELSALTSKSEGNYGAMKRSPSNGSLGSLSGFSLLAKVTQASGQFHRQRQGNKLKEAWKIDENRQQEFSRLLLQEAGKVNALYSKIFQELEGRLQLLTEHAGPSYQFITPRTHNFKNMRKAVKRHVSTMITGEEEEEDLETIEELDESTDEEDDTKGKHTTPKRRRIREADSIKRDMMDLYRRAKLLGNFGIMNSTGFVKIIKKFEKAFPEKKGYFVFITKNGSICDDGRSATVLCDKMEHLFSNWFCQNNIIEARSNLFQRKGDALDMDWSQLRLGYRLGMCSILAIWVCWDCVWGLVKDGNSTIGGRTAFPVFRACGGLLLVHWFWGMSVYIWNRYRINYIFLFDFDPRTVSPAIDIFEDATAETLVFLIIMLLYYKAGAGTIPHVIPSGSYPFILVVYTLKCVFFPLRTRAPLWKSIAAVLTAPLTAPSFFHTYVADVFTSMVKVFQDILWTICYITSGDFLDGEIENSERFNRPVKNWHKTNVYTKVLIPLVCLFPLWIRFFQCLRRYTDTGNRMPHLANAFKYALSQTVTLFGAFHPLYLMRSQQGPATDYSFFGAVLSFSNLFELFWFFLFVSSSLYSFFWDVYMDWGLGRPAHGFLGTRLMYPKKIQYYGVMVADLFLRFMWVQSLIPPNSGAVFEIPSYLTMINMSLELFRRTLWGFFRLEHEHRSNTEGFRRVDFVPLHFDTGQTHTNQRKHDHMGWYVLMEVFAVTLTVLTISAGSIIAAERATNGVLGSSEYDL